VEEILLEIALEISNSESFVIHHEIKMQFQHPVFLIVIERLYNSAFFYFSSNCASTTVTKVAMRILVH